jgi:hypothetical protein
VRNRSRVHVDSLAVCRQYSPSMQRRFAVLLVAVASACGRAGYDPLDQAGDGGAGLGGSDGSVFTASGVAHDTFLDSADRGANFGALEALRTADSPPATILLRFDLAGAPDGAIARAAALTVWTTDAGQDATRVRIFRVFEDWDEGSEAGAAGAASWDLRAPGQAWTKAGCGVGSRDAAARAEFEVDASSTRHEVALPTAVVQGWLDEPASNLGLALVATSGGGVEIASSQTSAPARRPALVVEWSP